MPEAANDRMKTFKAIFRFSLQSILILVQKKSRQMNIIQIAYSIKPGF